MRSWRKADREWPCWSLAFAVPSERALDLLASYAPLVEMGAGTGYWARLLQLRGVQVAAFDSVPTKHLEGGEAAGGGGRGGGGGGGTSRDRV